MALSRIARATRIEAADIAVAHAKGALARAHGRPLGGCLEPKHASEEHRAAFHAGWAEEDAAQTAEGDEA